MAHPGGTSGLVGKLFVESEVNCNADKYYQIFKHHVDLPGAVPHLYTSVKAVEGHGTTSGCVKEWCYIIEGKELTCKEITTYTDETRTIHHSVVEGDLMNDYKKFEVTLAVNPKATGHGSIVRWTVDYEKIKEDSPVPMPYLATFQQTIEDLNSHLCLVGKLFVESEVNCNADKYYQIFKHHVDLPGAVPHLYTSVKAVEGHGTTSGCVKEWCYIIEGKSLIVKEKTTYDDETRTTHHMAVGGDIMNDYKKFDATLVVNPKANGHGSIVKWTIDYEKLNEDSPVPIPYLAFFQQVIEDLNSHLIASD
ncbi:hypothetical protein MKX03_002388 [Papaver bracteatum]|nr:hypothetical protein MKX03_002388 [Papaver bracteatum]